jgi:hypothetical protein
VFFRDQELDPKEQLELGRYYGEIEAHPMGPQVPGMPGVTVLWPYYNNQKYVRNSHFRKPGGAARWHSDLVHEKHPAGITHLHNVISLFCTRVYGRIRFPRLEGIHFGPVVMQPMKNFLLISEKSLMGNTQFTTPTILTYYSLLTF